MSELIVLTLRGAYGRPTLVEDWLKGLDFRIADEPYCSIRDTWFISEVYDVLEFVNLDGSLVERSELGLAYTITSTTKALDESKLS